VRARAYVCACLAVLNKSLRHTPRESRIYIYNVSVVPCVRARADIIYYRSVSSCICFFRCVPTSLLFSTWLCSYHQKVCLVYNYFNKIGSIPQTDTPEEIEGALHSTL